ncbi:MAG: Gfo/Idh/MocA family oxidoreductase, partial [bacterium]|nr:Gfo/Idh/MocA family oxidoreductase [bacterium]
RIAVLGCGVIAQVKHLPNLWRLRDRFAVVAICDIDPAALEQAARWAPSAKIYTHAQQMFADADAFEAVLVASSGSHVAEVTGAARLGKHVFVEKPLALTAEQGRQLVAEIDGAGIVCMVGYMKRYSPDVRQLVDDASRETLRLVRADLAHPPEDAYLVAALGRVRERPTSLLNSVQGQVSTGRCAETLGKTLGPRDSLSSRVGHFVLATSVVHDINLIRATLGPRLEVINAAFWNGGLAGQATLAARSGAIALLSYAFVEAGSYSEKLVFVGETRRFEACFPSPYLNHMPLRVRVEDPSVGLDMPQWFDREVSYADPFELELTAFHNRVVRGDNMPTDAGDGLADLEIIAEIARKGIDIDQGGEENRAGRSRRG